MRIQLSPAQVQVRIREVQRSRLFNSGIKKVAKTAQGPEFVALCAIMSVEMSARPLDLRMIEWLYWMAAKATGLQGPTVGRMQVRCSSPLLTDHIKLCRIHLQKVLGPAWYESDPAKIAARYCGPEVNQAANWMNAFTYARAQLQTSTSHLTT